MKPPSLRNAARVRITLVLSFFAIVVFAFPSNFIAQKTSYAVVAVESKGSRLSFYDSITGEKTGSVPLGLKPHEVEISPDGRTAFVTNFGIEDYDHHIGTPGNSVSVIDIASAREKYKLSTENLTTTSRLSFSGKAPHGVKLRPSKRDELFVNTEVGGDFMLVYNLKTRKLKRFFSVPEGSHNFIFSPDGKFIYLFAGPNGVFKIDADTGGILSSAKLGSPARGLHYTTDNRFIIASGRGEAALLNPGNLSIERRFENLGVGQMLYPMPSPDGKYILFPAPEDSLVIVMDIKTGEVVRRLKAGSAPIAIALSPNGDKAYVSSDSDTEFKVIDLHTFDFTKFADADGSNGIAISIKVKR
jgi:DNA-binding beta-propeller fold protein YncE